MLNLGYEAEVVRVYEADTIVGTTTDTTDVVDMSGYEAVSFVVVAGAIGAAGLTVTAQQDENDAVAFPDPEALAGCQVVFADAGDSDLVGIIDVGKPENRYIRLSMVAGANDCVVDGVLAVCYRARDLPVTQGATVVATTVAITPAAV